MTRDVGRRLLLGAGPVVLGAAVAGGSTGACYSAGAGTSPPPNSFYFPVGLAVSRGGNVLYAVNSDFDLQWSGGTLQSYDLFKLRRDVAASVATPSPQCQGGPDPVRSGSGLQLGQACARPKDTSEYIEDHVIIGAFATDLQISRAGDRLYAPVRGDGTLTWAGLALDDPDAPASDITPTFAPFHIDCGAGSDNRCDAAHHSGSDPNERGNTRHATMPGEPFGMAQSEDGSAVVVTHQTDTKTSLFATDFGGTSGAGPSMQFVLDGLPLGGSGIAAIPHDPDALPPPCPNAAEVTPPCVRPSFLETSRNTAELDLLRYYNDNGVGVVTGESSVRRPFLTRDFVFPFTANAPGTDSRGIVIDPTPRLACKWSKTRFSATPPFSQLSPADARACAEQPARVFFANRTPPSLAIGEVGIPVPSSTGQQTFDPDAVQIRRSVSLPIGPSRVYLAPIVDPHGRYALRVFVVGFDSNTVSIFNPDAADFRAPEATIFVGQGPFAMAFDPFDLDQVAQNAPVPEDTRPGPMSGASSPGPLLRYRFAYVASFTGSYVQVIDLDQHNSPATFENVVFTLGQPTKPKGT